MSSFFFSLEESAAETKRRLDPATRVWYIKNMKNLLKLIEKHSQQDRRTRYRDRRGHYASSALQDMRDQYWAMTGEPETDPTDFWGKIKMLVGSAVEAELVKQYFSDLHWYGVHLLGTQVPVGGSNPAWDGALDVLLRYKAEDGKYKNYVVEIKTKSGYGATLMLENPEASPEYLAQIGLYLKDLNKKGITNEGCLFYVLLSDASFGRLLAIHCRYDAASDEVIAYQAEHMGGETREIDQRLKIGDIEARWQNLEKHIAEKKVPKSDYQYKYPLTQEMLQTMSDDKIRKAIRGEVVIGDWQPRYSRYLSKALEYDKVKRGYSDSELKLLRDEYLKRHPKSKI